MDRRQLYEASRGAGIAAGRSMDTLRQIRLMKFGQPKAAKFLKLLVKSRKIDPVLRPV